MSTASPPLAVPGFAAALHFWFKLGLVSFGGPAGQIALMHSELVERRRWISEARFLHALNYCMVLPGPEAQQLATYLGWLMHRTRGGIAAGVLFVLPSLLLLIALSWLYVALGSQPLVAGLFYGIKPAVVALVVQAVHRIGGRALRSRVLWLIAGAALVASWWLPFPLLILAAALAGWAGGRWWPVSFGGGAALAKLKAPAQGALIDDDTPTPEHARYSRRRLLKVLVAGLLLWALPMAVLVLLSGWHGTLAQMGWFFTQAALLSFGGAYAVLPFMFQGAVLHYGWLSTTQMIDGLALGETTPGPLIMVVAFVGFVGAYQQALFGPELRWLAGAAAATVVSWFTFLPSFIFILAGGPLVEATHGKLGFTAPLAGITAAVVAVIGKLALFFAGHVFWPAGAGVDALAVAIAIAALIALVRFRRGAIEVIAVCAVIGLVRGGMF